MRPGMSRNETMSLKSNGNSAANSPVSTAECRVVILEPSDFSRFSHDGNGSAGDSFVGQVHSVLFAHGAAGMKIREQGILDAHFVRERLVRPYAVNAHSEHFRIQRLELFHVIHKARVFARANRAPEIG